VYLPAEHHKKLKAVAEKRKASELIRNAIQMILDGNDAYKSGYNAGLQDAIDVVQNCKETYIIIVNGVDMATYLSASIELLEKKNER
jgi:hypothetical protein